MIPLKNYSFHFYLRKSSANFREQEKVICYISGAVFISGFILTSCSFNSSHKSLVEQIRKQRKDSASKTNASEK